MTRSAIPSAQQVFVSELSDDAKGNLGLTSKITRAAAAFAVFAFLGAVRQVWMGLRFVAFSGSWTAWHIITCLEIVLAPCWLLVAWMLWKYAKSLEQLRRNGIRFTEAIIEDQAKLWLAMGLVMFLMLVRVALFWGASTTIESP